MKKQKIGLILIVLMANLFVNQTLQSAQSALRSDRELRKKQDQVVKILEVLEASLEGFYLQELLKALQAAMPAGSSFLTRQFVKNVIKGMSIPDGIKKVMTIRFDQDRNALEELQKLLPSVEVMKKPDTAYIEEEKALMGIQADALNLLLKEEMSFCNQPFAKEDGKSLNLLKEALQLEKQGLLKEADKKKSEFRYSLLILGESKSEVFKKLHPISMFRYPEFAKFFRKYGCTQAANGYMRKNPVNDISRLINAIRAHRCIEANKLNLLGVPHKCFGCFKGSWYTYAARVKHTDLPTMSSEQINQLNKFIELTGFSDFASGNLLYDQRNNKLMIVDTGNDSFMSSRVRPLLPYNTQYDDPDIDFERVKLEFADYASVINTQDLSFNSSDSELWLDIENKMRQVMGLPLKRCG